MSCPNCQASVEEGTVICPSCDFVIDPKAFESLPPDTTGEDSITGKREPAPRKPIAVVKKGPTRRSTVSTPGAGGTKRPATGSKPAAARKVAMPDAPARPLRAPREEPKEDWHWKPDGSQAKPAAGPASGGILDPEESMKDLKAFIGNLATADKIAFVGAVGTALACLFPWKDTVVDDGEVMGLLTLGWLAFVASLLMLVAMVIRVRGSMANLPPLVPWLVQFVGACFCVVWCLIFVKISWDPTLARSPWGNFERMTSRPAAGVFIAVLTSIVALGGTLLGLQEKPRG